MNQLRRAGPDRRVLIEEQVREAEIQAAIELKHLEIERKCLEERQAKVQTEIERLGESEARILAHRHEVHRSLLWLSLSVVLAWLGAWWSLGWYGMLLWERALLATCVVVPPIVGWEAFLQSFPSIAKRNLSKLMGGVGLFMILCGATSGVLLASGRSAGVALEEERRQAVEIQTGDDLTAASASSGTKERADRVKRLLGIIAMAAAALLTVSGEASCGISQYEYHRHRLVVKTTEPFYQEARDLRGRLVENAQRQEEVRRSPELLASRLAIAAWQTEAEEVRAEEAALRQREEEEARANSMAPVVRRVIIGFVVGVAVLLALAALSWAGESKETTVVLVDLSSSTVDGEFSQNLRAVEGVIKRMEAGTARLVVFGITERSFGSAPLFRTASPTTPGRFGEYLDEWRGRAIQEWRKVAAGLKPAADRSDVFGAIARAAVELDESPQGRRRLIVLSDMRHVGGGFNFERSVGDSRSLIESAARQGLIPRLEGVRVWVLGAHTAGLTQTRWAELKTFWTEYVRRARAELVAFGPNRRLAE